MINPSGYPAQLRQVNFMTRVYAWMSIALAITTASAYWVVTTPAIFDFIFKNPYALMVLIVVQFGLVIAISGLLDRISFATAVGLFLLYSLSMGCTLSIVFAIYTAQSLVTTFLVTAGTFAAMAVYGYFTKSDLTTMGNILLMGLIGLVIAMLVNLWFKNEKFDIVLSGIGVVIFTLLIAFDSQRIKHMGQTLLAQGQEVNKVALLGSLTLYLDFVNLFLFLLRFLGKRNE